MTVFVDTTSRMSAVIAIEQAKPPAERDFSITNLGQPMLFQGAGAVRDDITEAICYARLQLDGVMRTLAAK